MRLKNIVLSLCISVFSWTPSVFAKTVDEIRQDWNAGQALLQQNRLRYFTRSQDPDKLKIAYHLIGTADAKKTVVIVPGFAESQYKYAELISDLSQQGYNVAALSLRGMGSSSRYKRPAGVEKEMHAQTVHIAKFTDYVDDLSVFVESIVEKEFPKTDMYVFAHSTGGLVATYYLAESKNSPFKAAVLNSPLYGLGFGLAKRLLLDVGYLLFPSISAPIPVQSTFDASKALFTEQKDTNDETRWKLYNDFLTKNPQLVQSVPSRAWIQNIEVATGATPLSKLAAALKTPTLLFQAEQDAYVDTSAHDRFAAYHTKQNLKALEIQKFKGAYHSVWRGADYSEALEALLKKFQ